MPFFLLLSAAGLFTVIFPKISWRLSSKRARYTEASDMTVLAMRIVGVALIITGLILTYCTKELI